MNDVQKVLSDAELAIWNVAVRKRGQMLLDQINRAANLGQGMPSAAVVVLAEALRVLQQEGSPDEKLRRFAKELRLGKPRGRPAKADGSDRAYFCFRQEANGLTRTEAIEKAMAKYHVGLRAIQRDIKDNAHAERILNELTAEEAKSASGSGSDNNSADLLS